MTTALVTGANKGIGLEIVKKLIAKGMTVHLGARGQEKGEKAAADVGARFVQVDVTDPASSGGPPTASTASTCSSTTRASPAAG